MKEMFLEIYNQIIDFTTFLWGYLLFVLWLLVFCLTFGNVYLSLGGN